MDKLIKSLKNKLMVAYSAVLARAQRGYPLEGYQSILDGMAALEFIENFEVEDSDKIRIIEQHIFKLSNEK